MKKEVLFIIRFVILNFLLMVGVIGIFGVPSDELSIVGWIISLILSKIIGFGSIILMIYLGDKWLGRFFEIMEDLK